MCHVTLSDPGVMRGQQQHWLSQSGHPKPLTLPCTLAPYALHQPHIALVGARQDQ